MSSGEYLRASLYDHSRTPPLTSVFLLYPLLDTSLRHTPRTSFSHGYCIIFPSQAPHSSTLLVSRTSTSNTFAYVSCNTFLFSPLVNGSPHPALYEPPPPEHMGKATKRTKLTRCTPARVATTPPPPGPADAPLLFSFPSFISAFEGIAVAFRFAGGVLLSPGSLVPSHHLQESSPNRVPFTERIRSAHSKPASPKIPKGGVKDAGTIRVIPFVYGDLQKYSTCVVRYIMGAVRNEGLAQCSEVCESLFCSREDVSKRRVRNYEGG